MKRRSALRAVGRCVLFAAVTLAVWKAIDFALTDDVHAYSRVMLEELYAASGQIDTLFVGSSHCYRSFDPAIMDDALDKTTFVAGTSQQMLDGAYHLLVEAGEENRLETVYLECFFTAYQQQSSSKVPLACYLITDYMRPSLNKYAYLWEMGGAAALVDDLLPARHTIADPGELTALWRAKLTDAYTPGNYAYVTYPGEEEYRGKGFVYTYGTPPYGFGAIGAIDAEQPITPFAQTYLDKITDYCRENDIRLVLVTAPLPSAFAAHTENYQALVDALAAYAAENGLDDWDFTLYKDTKALAMEESDYSDAHHLNGEGAGKFTRAFCDVVKKAEAGEDTATLFYPTLAEKLSLAPDATAGMD